MEAFSDGVLAVIITVMVLELHPPGDSSWTALQHVGLGFVDDDRRRWRRPRWAGRRPTWRRRAGRGNLALGIPALRTP